MRREEYFKIGLSMVDGMGIQLAMKLIEHCGSAEGIFREKAKNLLKIRGLRPSVISSMRSKQIFDRIEKELKFISQEQITTLFFTDNNFPYRLRHCIDCPILLYVRGKSNLNLEKVISVVGTRKPSKYGVDFTERLIDDLKDYQLMVISGMAYGIDGLVHRECLRKNLRTIGVLGHGLNITYPAQHRELFRMMGEKEMLLTEFSSQDGFYKQNFVKRNRIVAGMCDAVIVVESGKKGGSLITANLANSYNRDVFALPGRYMDKLSAGCNSLIKNHKSAMLESAEDLIRAMMWEQEESKKKERQIELMLTLSDDETKIMNYLNAHDEVFIEKLAETTKIPLQKLSSLLLSLELRGMIAVVPGNKYKLI